MLTAGSCGSGTEHYISVKYGEQTHSIRKKDFFNKFSLLKLNVNIVTFLILLAFYSYIILVHFDCSFLCIY